MTNITITDRASWLAFRADWRTRYAAASEAVRETKRSMRSAVAERRSSSDRSIIARIDEDRMPSLQSAREFDRAYARRLMSELNSAKEVRDNLLAAAKEERLKAA